MYRIIMSSEYLLWFENQTDKIQSQIVARFNRIVEFGDFGDVKKIDPQIAELKWKSGLRIYFSLSRDDGDLILLLLGGNKNSQKKDISKAKKLVRDLIKEDE